MHTVLAAAAALFSGLLSPAQADNQVVFPLSLAQVSGPPSPTRVDHRIVLPLSLARIEGNTHEGTLINLPYVRWQQIDSDSASTAHGVKFLRFRRDGVVASPSAKGRTVDVEIRMGNQQLAGFGGNFAGNYLQPPTTVMTRSSVNLPNWSQLPTIGPARFDMTFPVTSTWYHNGAVSLVWEIEVWENTPAPGSYQIDADAAGGTSSGAAVALGSGCTTSNGVFTNVSTFDVTNYNADFSMTLTASGAPPRALVSYLVGSFDPNLSLGLCAGLRVFPIASFPIGIANAAGQAQIAFRSINYNPAWYGVPLYTQALAPDAAQPRVSLAFSNGVELKLPPTAHVLRHIFSTTPGAATGQGPFPGGVVIEISDS